MTITGLRPLPSARFGKATAFIITGKQKPKIPITGNHFSMDPRFWPVGNPILNLMADGFDRSQFVDGLDQVYGMMVSEDRGMNLEAHLLQGGKQLVYVADDDKFGKKTDWKSFFKGKKLPPEVEIRDFKRKQEALKALKLNKSSLIHTFTHVLTATKSVQPHVSKSAGQPFSILGVLGSFLPWNWPCFK